MASSQDLPPSSWSGTQLPAGFLTVDQVYNLSSEKLKSNNMVNVIGFLKDFQPPYQTRGTDCKCTLEIVDQSLENGLPGLKVIIFWPEEKMPKQKYGVGDAVIVRSAKAQMYRGVPSLMANYITEFHVLPASEIPSEPHGPLSNLWHSHPPSKSRSPTVGETAYVIRANSHVEEMALPTAMEFEQRSMQAMNVKDKFRLLKDIEPSHFYDLLGEVIHIFDSGNNTVTVYLSDYTENKEFYNNTWREGGATSSGRDGDDFAYIPQKGVKAWPGPYGKLSMQLTLYDAHANYIRDNVEIKDWVLLRNVHIKQAKQLEGVLRTDRNAFEGKVQVEVMQQSREPDENDPRWKEAVKRKHEWWKKFERQKKELLGQVPGLADKRKQEGQPSKKNSKIRRLERRAAADRKAAAKDAIALTRRDLNDNIRCSDPQQPIVSLADIFTPRKIKAKNGQGYFSPFNVCKYKANVRVVGYFPNRIEDFAVGHRASEYDMLSDYSGGEDTDREGDMRAFKSGKGFPKKNWEWRFALEVVDADSKASKERMWLMVDNHAAQMLLNLDATNLRSDVEALHELKEQLCILWGDLEERKSVVDGRTPQKTPASTSLETISLASSPNRKPGEQPPIDSDDEDQRQGREGPGISTRLPSLKERDLNLGPDGSASKLPAEMLVNNKAFTCCIKQYGIKVDEDDPSMANAGNAKRWERRFGLFNTQIV